MRLFNHEEHEGHEEKQLQGLPGGPDEKTLLIRIYGQAVVSFIRYPGLGALSFKCLSCSIMILHGEQKTVFQSMHFMSLNTEP